MPGASLDPLIHPVFGLAKSPRATPIQIRLGGFAIAVEAPLGRTIATIWDADILIWAACHMTELRARGEPVPRSLAATPERILAFIGRDTTVRHCHRLKAALDRLQYTTVSMALHDTAERRLDRFSWLSEWTEHADAHGRTTGIALVVPEWLRRAILDGAIALTADRSYFGLRNGLDAGFTASQQTSSAARRRKRPSTCALCMLQARASHRSPASRAKSKTSCIANLSPASGCACNSGEAGRAHSFSTPSPIRSPEIRRAQAEPSRRRTGDESRAAAWPHPCRTHLAREAHRALDPVRPRCRRDNPRSRRRILSFAPGSIFAFVRWAANDFGTIISRIDIVRAVESGEPYSTLPFVRPGGEILLRITGWPKVQRVLQAIDAVEQLGIEATDTCPDHWRHVHNRLAAGYEPRPYTRGRHAAWLARRRIAP